LRVNVLCLCPRVVASTHAHGVNRYWEIYQQFVALFEEKMEGMLPLQLMICAGVVRLWMAFFSGLRLRGAMHGQAQKTHNNCRVPESRGFHKRGVLCDVQGCAWVAALKCNCSGKGLTRVRRRGRVVSVGGR
jgi:hypothetical protein